MRFAKLSCLLLGLAAIPCFATTLGIVIDSSSLLSPPTSGYIDFLFNGGYPATAVISNFSIAGGSLDSGSVTGYGTVTGTLPGDVVMHDDNANYDQGLTFGSSIAFDLTLEGTPTGSIGDVFTLTFFNSSFSGGLLTGNEDDFWLMQFQMDTEGNITPVAYANPSGGRSFATSYVIPEPVSGFLCAAALAGIFFLRRRRLCDRS
jgi:hypothetical protein